MSGGLLNARWRRSIAACGYGPAEALFGFPADLFGALICSYECTWCESCAAELGHRCPNCGGELVARPTRAAG